MRLDECDVDGILASRTTHLIRPFIGDTFTDIYYLDRKRMLVNDRAITNIHRIENKYKRSLVFTALAQSCILK